MTYALYWVHVPLAPALAAVVIYRGFNFLIVAAPAVVPGQRGAFRAERARRLDEEDGSARRFRAGLHARSRATIVAAWR
jgi:hypothetical protein